MKFELYEISCQGEGSLVDDIAWFARKRSMGDREVPVSGKTVALEKAEEVVRPNAANMWIMDVMEARSNDFPGRYTAERKNEDLPVQKGDRASQRTMALYVPGNRRDYLVCQYNHHGIKAGMIAEYFKGDRAYLVKPVVNENAVKTFEQSESVTAFHIKIAASEFSAPWLAGSSMRRSMQEGRDHDAGYIEIKYALGREGRGGALRGIRELVRRFYQHAPTNDAESHNAGVSVMRATVKRQFDAAAEILDLLNHRVVHLVDDDAFKKTAGGRYDYSSRKKEIIASLPHFKKYMSG